MNTYADKSKVNRTLAGNVFQKHGDKYSTLKFIDNRHESIAQRKLQQIIDNSVLVKKTASLQEISSKRSTLQAKRISQSQMRGMGFAGPYAGQTWQWNAPGGIHVTIRRVGGEVTHFHVRRDTVGGVYNRIDYNEVNGVWTEGNVNVPAGEYLTEEMRTIARDTIDLINALVPPV